MQKQTDDSRVRPDLKCLSIGEIWDKLKYLSNQEGLSASGYIRQIILRQYKKERGKELISVG